MFQSYFDKNFRFWQYLVLWCLFAVLQSVCYLSFVPQPTAIIFADASAHAFIYAIIGILLWSVIKYGNFGALPAFQRAINYSALAILFIAINIGAGYGIHSLMGDEIQKSFQPYIYLRGFISVMVYYAMVQYFRYRLLRETAEETETETAPAPTTEKSATEAIEPETETTETTEKLERIAVKSGQKIHVIMIPEIVYLQADGDYVLIFTMTGKYLKEQTMKYFEEHLPPHQFARVHRSCIVNLEAISRIELYEKQSQQLTLKNGHQIKTSQAGYKLLRQKLNL
jgi:DNA-binding LytR/AlgR family response regulator